VLVGRAMQSHRGIACGSLRWTVLDTKCVSRRVECRSRIDPVKAAWQCMDLVRCLRAVALCFMCGIMLDCQELWAAGACLWGPATSDVCSVTAACDTQCMLAGFFFFFACGIIGCLSFRLASAGAWCAASSVRVWCMCQKSTKHYTSQNLGTVYTPVGHTGRHRLV
jgi:hypothetical protein